ncbi:MAG: HD domain-containing protein [Candidatus Paceibacterota bacterium]|jgi:uncharacterized protein
MTKLEKVRKLVKSQFDEVDWKNHVSLVVQYANKLSRIYKTNREITELAALLHDIGRVGIKKDQEHHIVGVARAESILKKLNYPRETIEEVKHCVLTHRTSKGPKPKTMTAKIVANADAMAHLDALPVFFYWRTKQGYDFNTMLEWTHEKLKKDWASKISLPEARKLVRNQYKATMLLLDILLKNNKNE